MFTRTIYIAVLQYPSGESKAFYGNYNQALAYFHDFFEDCKDCNRKGSIVALQEATATISEYGITSITSINHIEIIQRF